MGKNAGSAKSRNYLLTFNNPVEHGWEHEKIKEVLHNGYTSLCFYCLGDEIGNETQTYHTHALVCFNGPIAFDSLKKRFPEAHIDVCFGTPAECRDYVMKSGKWAEDPKHDTVVEGTFEEWGDLPGSSGEQGRRTDIEGMLELCKQGYTLPEILAVYPQGLRYMSALKEAREIYRRENAPERREVEVIYIWGVTGTGKTRYVMDKHRDNVYRVTDYKHPFDGYDGEEVIVFDEYHSQFDVTQFLDYTDRYPVELRCRYANKVALYTKVYIISNIPLEDQYPDVRRYEPETWAAIKRRVHHVWEFTAEGCNSVDEEEAPERAEFTPMSA